MKPKNFPGRKDERRRRALDRLLVGGESLPLSNERVEIEALWERLSETAETLRSKKNRTGEE